MTPLPFALLLAASTVCGDPLSFQVLLDRHGFSPGAIDGRLGTNTIRALAAFQHARGLASGGKADCGTWAALTSDDTAPATTKYQITDADGRGPFVKRIPRDIGQQAGLPHLGYQNVLEL